MAAVWPPRCQQISALRPGFQFWIPSETGLGYEYEGLAKLARLVGPSRAKDIMFSARFMPAEEAKEMGIINFIADRDAIEAQCIEYTQRVAGNTPMTVRPLKPPSILGSAAAASTRSMKYVRWSTPASPGDYKEGRRAFAAKENPNSKPNNQRQPMTDAVTFCILIIGNEILQGAPKTSMSAIWRKP